MLTSWSSPTKNEALVLSLTLRKGRGCGRGALVSSRNPRFSTEKVPQIFEEEGVLLPNWMHGWAAQDMGPQIGQNVSTDAYCMSMMMSLTPYCTDVECSDLNFFVHIEPELSPNRTSQA